MKLISIISLAFVAFGLAAQPAASSGSPTNLLALTNAGLSQVLTLYAECTGKSLLEHHLLPYDAKFTFTQPVSTPAEARIAIEAGLAEKSVLTIPDGDKFIMVVPKSLAAYAKPAAPVEPASSKGNSSEKELIPPGMISFNGASENQMLTLCAELLGKKLDRNELPRWSGSSIHFKTVTPISKQEAIYAVKTLLAWRGIELVPAGEGFVKPVRISEKN